MSKELATYGQLSAILSSIESEINRSPAFEILNRNKIKMFKKENQLRISMFYDQRKKIFDSCVKKDADGNYQMRSQEVTKVITGWFKKKTVVQEPLKEEFDYISPKHKEDFEMRTKMFLSQSIELFV